MHTMCSKMKRIVQIIAHTIKRKIFLLAHQLF